MIDVQDPSGFKDFIQDIRSEMKPRTDVVPSPFDSRCGCLADYSVDESIVVGEFLPPPKLGIFIVELICNPRYYCL